MKISLEWLKAYCPELTLSPQEIADKLMLAGFPVESIEPAGDDTVLDVEVTSNRPDLLCYLGMAREVAALAGVRVVRPKVQPAGDAGPELAARTAIKLQTPECPYYTARIIENVKVGPSPAWLARRLEAIGLRPINNVVDITNYVMMEHSQPLHAFDYSKLTLPSGNVRPIIVRRAVKGEKMVSIDSHLRELDPSMMVIADAVRPVAVAGVMGGLDTEVGTGTTTVLIESAYFDPMSVRATARKLALFSDSSYRFERGVDPGGVEEASNRATDLMIELAGGRALPGLAIDPASSGWASRPVHGPGGVLKVSMRLARLRALLGIDVPVDRVLDIFGRLMLTPELLDNGQAVRCSIPSFRQDLRREVDLIEEVARVEGYDKIPVRDRIEVVVRPPNVRQATIRKVARALCGLGFFETVSMTFVTADRAELFARGTPGRLETTHTSRKSENALRRSLLPSLLAARRHNETMQVKRADLFEIASVFNPLPPSPCNQGEGRGEGSAADPSRPPTPDPRHPTPEPLRLGLVADGDFRAARGALEQAANVLNRRAAQELTYQPTDRAEFTPGQAAAVMLNGRQIGLIGTIADATRAKFELGSRQELTAAEVDLEPLLALAAEQRTCSPLARFPAIERDLSILVDEPVTWGQVERTIRESATPELESIEFVDLFRGKQFPAGKKSFTFTLRYRLADGTLTNEQANAFAARTVEALTAKLGAALRDK